jgi:threonine synthase
VKSNRDRHKPIRKPNTICKSLAIGDPADGYFSAQLIKNSGGWAEDVTDEEIVECMVLLAKTEGVFAETAGGTTLAVTRKLIEQGRIPRDEEIVICITGNGLKTQDCIADALEAPANIKPSLEAFDAVYTGAADTVLV